MRKILNMLNMPFSRITVIRIQLSIFFLLLFLSTFLVYYNYVYVHSWMYEGTLHSSFCIQLLSVPGRDSPMDDAEKLFFLDFIGSCMIDFDKNPNPKMPSLKILFTEKASFAFDISKIFIDCLLELPGITPEMAEFINKVDDPEYLVEENFFELQLLFVTFIEHYRKHVEPYLNLGGLDNELIIFFRYIRKFPYFIYAAQNRTWINAEIKYMHIYKTLDPSDPRHTTFPKFELTLKDWGPELSGLDYARQTCKYFMREGRIYVLNYVRKARGVYNPNPQSLLEAFLQRTHPHELLCHTTCFCRSKSIKDVFPTKDAGKKWIVWPGCYF